MRIAGGSEITAIYAGINAKQKAFFAMLIGGGFAGLAGGVELLSQTHRVSTGISQGFGYTAIIVAAITGMRPIGIFFGWISIWSSIYWRFSYSNNWGKHIYCRYYPSIYAFWCINNSVFFQLSIKKS